MDEHVTGQDQADVRVDDEVETNVEEAGAGPDLLEELAAAKAELDAAREALASSERRRALETALAEAGALDVEAGVLLAEASMRREGVDAGEAVAGLRRSRAWLFGAGDAGGVGVGSGVMVERDEAEASDGLSGLAGRASATGDRRSVLAYLRAKRVAG